MRCLQVEEHELRVLEVRDPRVGEARHRGTVDDAVVGAPAHVHHARLDEVARLVVLWHGARLAEAALSDPTNLALLAQNLAAEQSSLVLIGLVATANVALGVWRPQFRSRAKASS